MNCFFFSSLLAFIMFHVVFVNSFAAYIQCISSVRFSFSLRLLVYFYFVFFFLSLVQVPSPMYFFFSHLIFSFLTHFTCSELCLMCTFWSCNRLKDLSTLRHCTEEERRNDGEKKNSNGTRVPKRRWHEWKE